METAERRSVQEGYRRCKLVLALVAALSAAGCTPLGLGSAREREARPIVVRASDIEKYPPGSPEQGFLRWWRQLQFNNPAGAASYYASWLRISPNDVERNLRFAPQYFHFGTRPVIRDTQRQGDVEHLTATVLLTATLPDGGVTRARLTLEFDMVREDGIWKQAHDRFVTQLARNAESAPPKAGALPIPDTGTK
jgi:hypothetical protein